MRSSFTVSLLLLLSLLILSEKVQGIRLDKGSMLVGQHKSIHMEEMNVASTKTSINGANEEARKDHGQFSGNNNRKLISVTPSTTTTTITSNSKNLEKNGKIKADHDPDSDGEKSTTFNNKSQQYDLGGDDHDHHDDHREGKSNNNHVNTLTTQNPNAKHEYYPDDVDLAEMDYSPARRKTPIHN